MSIPIIDLFAGPGGLGEGFSSLVDEQGRRLFDIQLSIEKDKNAHETLELRSFFRQFKIGAAPKEYYNVIRKNSIALRNEAKNELYEKYPKEYKRAKEEAWLAELGHADFPDEVIDERIIQSLDEENGNWLLIGGPPCQAYSLVGRSRNQWGDNLNKEDHRVHLYKQYLRIIAKHQPSVFVMENVKGLLSAKVDGEMVFQWILRDLSDPSSVFGDYDSRLKYKIFSLSTKPESVDSDCHPKYASNRDFLIKAEEFGVPQKRHRVILLGIREDINVSPLPLDSKDKINLMSVIGDLPSIRSSISKKYIRSEKIVTDGKEKKKRFYEPVNKSSDTWLNTIREFREEIIAWLSLKPEELVNNEVFIYGTGNEFIRCDTPSKNNPLYEWYRDGRLNGISNHQSRSHLYQDLLRYQFLSMYAHQHGRFPRLKEFSGFDEKLLPDHQNVDTGKFSDRFRVQLPNDAATTITSHISKDGHYFVHYDPDQCRSLTVREAARIQTFPDNYLFCGSRTAQFHQVGNAVPPLLANKIAQIVTHVFEAVQTKASINENKMVLT